MDLISLVKAQADSPRWGPFRLTKSEPTYRNAAIIAYLRTVYLPLVLKD